MKQSQKNYKRIVIKVGSSLLFGQYAGDDCFRFPLDNIASQVAQVVQEGKEVIIVSSGAIASGMRLLKMKSRPKELVSLQAAAAVGQNFLMNEYRKRLKNLNCAQILLTWDDFGDRKRYLNAKNTLLKVLELHCIPIVNENDTISTDEIKFGDNDRLSALVAKLVDADLLVILSDVDGLLDKNKEVIRIVPEINAEIKSLACPTKNRVCVGGMITKLDAAKIAMDSGISCIIANGKKEDIILSIIEEPERQGTLFVPKRFLNARDHWIAFGTKPKGKIIVDDGAKQALLNNKSLLSVGVSGVQGNFAAGDIVGIMDKRGCEFARGKVRLNYSELEKVKGRRSEKEVIHRDNIVITP